VSSTCEVLIRYRSSFLIDIATFHFCAVQTRAVFQKTNFSAFSDFANSVKLHTLSALAVRPISRTKYNAKLEQRNDASEKEDGLTIKTK